MNGNSKLRSQNSSGFDGDDLDEALPDNPVTVDPMTIRDIEVLETIKEGQTVYRAR